MDHPMPDGSSPFEPGDCGHLPCPPWMCDDAGAVAVDDEVSDEPELDPPHHVHDLWVALGLGEE